MEIEILDFDDLGSGLGKINEKVCFVKNGLPKEILKVKIVKENKNCSNCEIENIILKNKNRINPICPFYQECGGCNFLHATKSLENKFKIKKGEKFLGKIEKFYETREFNYRNKVIFHVKNGDIGFFKEKTNELVSINYCYLLNDKINEVLKLFLKNKDLNFNGNILIRVNNLEDSLVAITGNYKYIDLIKTSNLITNLIYNDKVIKGNSYFYEVVSNYKFKVSYKSFFQVNLDGLISIKIILESFLQDKNIRNALDLYSGTSVLGIIISKYVKNVISVEENKSSTDDALINKELNKINNLQVINGRVEDYIDTFKDIDLIILDPARRGLDLKTISYLKKIKSKYLIYIACKMDSLRRDTKYLKDDYEVLENYLVDMFPRTNEVESVSILKLK
ncbi:MAG: RsmD family RNA methyltransferase [Erysipelotrichaceae bacterium]|nr:RsmD family RNA methyltransferase [Erysipelotrichaceae bacterium]